MERETAMQRIVIPLNNGYQLVAEQNSDPNFDREIYIGVTDGNGVWWQDLAVIRNAFEITDNDSLRYKPDKFDVFVYGNENDEDFTEEFEIGLYKHSGI